MGPYSGFLGKQIEMVYRLEICDLFARGILLDDSNNCIRIEQHSDQYGSFPAFQLVIPYGWIIRLNESHSRPAPQDFA